MREFLNAHPKIKRIMIVMIVIAILVGAWLIGPLVARADDEAQLVPTRAVYLPLISSDDFVTAVPAATATATATPTPTATATPQPTATATATVVPVPTVAVTPSAFDSCGWFYCAAAIIPGYNTANCFLPASLDLDSSLLKNSANDNSWISFRDLEDTPGVDYPVVASLRIEQNRAVAIFSYDFAIIMATGKVGGLQREDIKFKLDCAKTAAQ